MTSKAANSNRLGSRRTNRHFADINAADATAWGAADTMWQKVEEDLAKMDRVEIGNSDDE
jgi:hypothetical protein